MGSLAAAMVDSWKKACAEADGVLAQSRSLPTGAVAEISPRIVH